MPCISTIWRRRHDEASGDASKLEGLAGAVSYGYRVVRVLEGQPRGEREIHPGEAAIVQRIFRAFVAGVSPKAIGKTLNAEGIPGPMGVAWSPSTIHGHAGRGTGILNNELYIGRLVWNRQRYVKDPDTGKRLARINPAEAWIITDVPHLRILDDDLWQAAKARQASTRSTMKAGIVRARRPKYLFSGLTQCGSCGGGFVLSSHDLLTCFNARSRGTCANRRSIKRQDVEARALRAMRERFFEPGAFAAFCEGFTAEMTLQRREHLAQMAGARRELAAVERRLNEIMKALGEGYRSEAWKAELVTLDARKAALTTLHWLSRRSRRCTHRWPRSSARRRRRSPQAWNTTSSGTPHDRRSAGFLDKIVIPAGRWTVTGRRELGVDAGRRAGPDPVATKAVGYVGCGGGI